MWRIFCKENSSVKVVNWDCKLAETRQHHKSWDSSVSTKIFVRIKPCCFCCFFWWSFSLQFVCLFGVYHPTQEFFTQMETSPLPVKGCKFLYLCWALMAIEQWVFFSVPHLLWHRASVYNGHLQRPRTLTPIAERLAVELSLPVFTTKVCRNRDSNTQPSTCRANTLTHCATATVSPFNSKTNF